MTKIVAIFLVLFSSVAYADSKCAGLYPNGVVITVPNTVELCNAEYVAVYNLSMKANIFSAEKFVGGKAHAARVNDFKHDERIPPENRAELSDYLSTKTDVYDRGHMAPAADQDTDAKVLASFLLSNMTPQQPTLNRISWKMLEESVREKAKGDTYVLTGAVYSTKPYTIGKNKIPVPSSYYKCVWYVKGSAPSCFVAQNKPHAPVVASTLGEVVKIAGYTIK